MVPLDWGNSLSSSCFTPQINSASSLEGSHVCSGRRKAPSDETRAPSPPPRESQQLFASAGQDVLQNVLW